jgi:DNA-binding CsgD family transcriptional regulator
MRRDWVGIIEAAYQLDGSDGHWLQSVADAVRPALDRGRGIVGYFFDASAQGLKLSGYVGSGAGPEEIELARNAHDIPIWQSPALLKATYRSASTIRYASSMAQKNWRVLKMRTGLSGSADVLIFNVADPSNKGCVFGAPDTSPAASVLAHRGSWSRIGAHVAAGLRLRRRLRAVGDGATTPQAILSPAGAVLHAEGAAKLRGAREVLRDAALAIERARGPMRRSDPAAAIELWRGMVDGRWSLVDRFDSDGRRFVVVHRNGLSTGGPRCLTDRERQIVSYVALAHPNKLIAYELGLSVSAVGTYLASALAKLGVASRVELVELASAFGVTPAPRLVSQAK